LYTLSLASKHPHGKQISILFNDNTTGTNKQYFNYDGLKEVLLHPKVQNRKVVVLTIIGAYRKGKSFFLNYCLRYLYGNVSSYSLSDRKYRINKYIFFISCSISLSAQHLILSRKRNGGVNWMSL